MVCSQPSALHQHAKKLFLCGLARLSDQEAPSRGRPAGTLQTLPGWSGICSMLQSVLESHPRNIGYLAVIPVSPTELSTVHLVLERIRTNARVLQQDDIIAVFDQAIYAKVMDILWKHPQQFAMIVPRTGAFHIACTFLAVLGRQFCDAGLRDIMVESRIVGSNAVDRVLCGKHYNRALHCHKAVMDSMFRMQWQAFLAWMDDQNRKRGNGLTEAVSALRSSVSASSMSSLATHGNAL